MVEKDGEDYGYAEFIKSVDTVILGRKTYEKVLSFGIEFPHKDKNCYVLSHSKTGTDDNGVTFFSGEIGDLIRTINEKPGKDIFAMEVRRL
jgi:dihydrofolate reductase